MSNRVEIHSIWQICIRAILLFLILLTYLGGNTAKCDTTVAPLPFSDDCNATAASRVVEILSVSGCERPPQPGRRREAYRCFADGTSARAVTLTVRGRGFPVNASLMRVLLKEHAHIPVHCGRGNDCGLVTMECINVQPSSVFPQQIFSCMLPHPTKSHHQKPQWLYRLERHPMWMDLELQRAPTKTERNEKGENIQEFVTIGILRHAVELCLAQDTTVPDTSDEDFIKEISENPLELLFQNAQGESDSTDPWLSLGIGGLKDQLQTLYRRVFLSRLPSLRGVTGSLKLPHVRGVILHGPPGNGKTLIARTLAILLDGDAKVTIINAADILSKYVGDSEKNLQELFIDPDEEENDDEDEDEDAFSKGMRDGRRKDMGRKRLHTIIIDEIEALFRRRGVSGDESAAKAVYDGLTNQLLTLMDGLIATDNILVFGLTNQLHLIDHALLRPGRFEVVIEVPHPNFEGRKEMFLIHTRELRERNYLAADVDVELLAAQTGGFSGADISGTVRAATSHALVRYHDALVKNATTKSSSSVSNNDANVNTEIMKERFHVSNEDFTLALEEMSQTKGQITPGETVGGIDFNRNRNAGGGANFSLVDYDGSFTRNKEEARRLLQSVHRSRLVCAVVVIIYGPPGSGKTTLAGELLKLGSFDVTTHLTSSVLNQSPQDNSLEVLNKLRSAVYFKGNTSILIENVENYLQNSGPMSMEILKTAFHEFKTTTSTSSTSTCGKRWLIVTTSEKEVFQDLLRSVEYDLQLSLHLIQRKDLLPLLHHYGILSSNISTADDVIRAYPTSLSYRQFLRITDLALGRAHDSFVNDAAMEKHEDGRFFSRSNDIFLQAGRNSKGDTKGVPLSNKKEINKFSAAVRDVVSAMGLTDAFDRVFTVHDTLEGDEVLW